MDCELSETCIKISLSSYENKELSYLYVLDIDDLYEKILNRR